MNPSQSTGYVTPAGVAGTSRRPSVTVRLDAPVLAEYQAFAAEHGLTVADLMRYGASVLIQGERARQALLAGELPCT